MDSIRQESVVKLVERFGTLGWEASMDVTREVLSKHTMVSTRIMTAGVVAIAHHLQRILT